MGQYLIKKGNHYASVSIFRKIGGIGWKITSLKMRFVFREECWWAPPRNNDDNDLNKLAGIGFGTNHHSNSVRLAWIPDFTSRGVIKIYGYTYDGKKEAPQFVSQYITSVHTGETCEAAIESHGNYDITVNKVTIHMDNIRQDPNLCFHLYPYFGGNNAAPHDMIIDLEYL
jgi:hypothetical protein